MSQNEVKRAILIAGMKSLKVQRSPKETWIVTLPSGATFTANNDYQLVQFAKDYKVV